jgi:hypothetical protein
LKTDDESLRAELRLRDIAGCVHTDWAQLAQHLNVSNDDIRKIQQDFAYADEQALAALHLWVQQRGPDATGTLLRLPSL